MNISFTSAININDSPINDWLHFYLREHLLGWSKAYGMQWGIADVDAHILKNRLIEQELEELVEAVRDKNKLVLCAYVDNTITGIIYVECREDRYMKIEIGCISWIYIDSTFRRKYIASMLINEAHAWMLERGLRTAEVMVTGSNTVAVGCYKKNGYNLVDQRLLANTSSSSDLICRSKKHQN